MFLLLILCFMVDSLQRISFPPLSILSECSRPASHLSKTIMVEGFDFRELASSVTGSNLLFEVAHAGTVMDVMQERSWM